MSASVAGVRRRFLGAELNGSLRENMMAGHTSLLQRTRELATTEIGFDDSECVFGWEPRFTQVWSRIQIRIRLNFDSNVSAVVRAALPGRWSRGIENVWNNKGGVAGNGESFCPFQFEVQFVTSGEHHEVRVVQGSGLTDMGIWYTADSGNVAAHEFGHMMGNNDEYTDTTCPNRLPVSTGTVMDDNSNNVPLRMLQPLADRLGSTAVPDP